MTPSFKTCAILLLTLCLIPRGLKAQDIYISNGQASDNPFYITPNTGNTGTTASTNPYYVAPKVSNNARQRASDSSKDTIYLQNDAKGPNFVSPQLIKPEYTDAQKRQLYIQQSRASNIANITRESDANSARIAANIARIKAERKAKYEAIEQAWLEQQQNAENDPSNNAAQGSPTPDTNTNLYYNGNSSTTSPGRVFNIQ